MYFELASLGQHLLQHGLHHLVLRVLLLPLRHVGWSYLCLDVELILGPGRLSLDAVGRLEFDGDVRIAKTLPKANAIGADTVGQYLEYAQGVPGLLGRIETTSKAIVFAGGVTCGTPGGRPVAMPQLSKAVIQNVRNMRCASRRIVRSAIRRIRLSSKLGQARDAAQGSLAASAMGSQWSGPARKFCGRYCFASAGGELVGPGDAGGGRCAGAG